MSDALNLVQLRSFVAIADCGGFGRAATALHLSQSTVSQHVRLLERRLKQELVLKDGRTTRFTPEGERLLQEARRILTVHDEALERLDAGGRARVVIGSTETAAEQVLPGLLTAMGAAFPEHDVQLHIDRSTQMADGIARGSIDLAVLLGFPDDAPGQEVTALPLQWYSAPGWVPPPPGARWPLVAYVEPCGMRQRAVASLSEAGSGVDVAVESTTLEGVLAAARAGFGIAVLPTSGTPPRGLVARPDLPPLGLIGVYLASRKGLDTELERAGLGAIEAFFAASAGETVTR